MFFDSRLKGYGWVFCGNNSQFNIGIGGLIEKKIIFQKFEGFIKIVNDRFDYDIRPAHSPDVWKIPIMLNNWNTPVSFYKNGIEFIGVGDVLGLAHPVIAAGIEPAWQSGWLLGESYDRTTHSINTAQYRHLLRKNLQLTSRKPFDILISTMLRIKCFPFKDQLSYVLMKIFHQKITDQIKKYPWFAMVHDGIKKIGFTAD
jgi:flavin-dependent dehydrogenase